MCIHHTIIQIIDIYDYFIKYMNIFLWGKYFDWILPLSGGFCIKSYSILQYRLRLNFNDYRVKSQSHVQNQTHKLWKQIVQEML